MRDDVLRSRSLSRYFFDDEITFLKHTGSTVHSSQKLLLEPTSLSHKREKRCAMLHITPCSAMPHAYHIYLMLRFIWHEILPWFPVSRNMHQSERWSVIWRWRKHSWPRVPCNRYWTLHRKRSQRKCFRQCCWIFIWWGYTGQVVGPWFGCEKCLVVGGVIVERNMPQGNYSAKNDCSKDRIPASPWRHVCISH